MTDNKDMMRFLFTASSIIEILLRDVALFAPHLKVKVYWLNMLKDYSLCLVYINDLSYSDSMEH